MWKMSYGCNLSPGLNPGLSSPACGLVGHQFKNNSRQSNVTSMENVCIDWDIGVYAWVDVCDALTGGLPLL